MNVTELARKLRIHPKRLLEILPEFGFDIGARAVKIDLRVAQQIIKEWKKIKTELDRRERAEKEKEKEKEKMERRESGVAVVIPALITVKDLAARMDMPVNQLIVELMKNGILANQNENIDQATAAIIAEELGFKVSAEAAANKSGQDTSEQVNKLETALKEGAKCERAPVVVVMGHVDHGKTKLLDAVREADVVATESGGITQHIGAYQVQWTDPKSKVKCPLTFIDTPGHEAFTVMRSRGAKVADIAVLVVAADDSVKPQTVEAISIIKAAKIPTVVAINKIDKAGADVKKVRTDLAAHNILSDEWGGDIPMVEISAKENLHIDKLLDTLLIVAAMHQQKIMADPNRAAAGTVIEAHVDKGQGPVATILVQTGTLKINDSLVINGEIYGKVRALKDANGLDLKEALPSTPVRILGFKTAPRVGDILDVGQQGVVGKVDVRSKQTVRTGAEQKLVALEQQDEDETRTKKVLKVVVKADTLGSLEALIGSLEKIKNEEASVKVVGKGLGNISADDVSRAETSKAILYAFNVQASPVAEEMLESTGVNFVQKQVIYDLFDDVKERLEKMLNPEVITSELGRLQISAIFRKDKNKMIVGGRVMGGKILKDVRARVKRGPDIIGEGKIVELKSGKQSIKELPAGNEGGLQFEGKVKLEAGDVLEAYTVEEKVKKLVIE